ncbi:MAG: RNA-binding S4 domain-containing protein [Clostridiales bacterium]
MRLDKFLKVSRIIKRRTVAKDVCDAGRIHVNGRSAKAGADLKVGDILSFNYGRRQMEVEILQLADTVRAEEAPNLYKVLKDIKINDDL